MAISQHLASFQILQMQAYQIYFHCFRHFHQYDLTFDDFDQVNSTFDGFEENDVFTLAEILFTSLNIPNLVVTVLPFSQIPPPQPSAEVVFQRFLFEFRQRNPN